MAAQTPRFLIENEGPNIENVKLALHEVVVYCSSHGLGHIALIVPAKGHFLGGIVAEALGQQQAKSLHAGRPLAVSGLNINITLAHPGNITTIPTGTFLVGMHLPSSVMQKVDDAAAPSAIAYLPWSEDEGKEWLSTWNPSIWGTNTWKVSATEMNPEVLAALEKLQRRVNVATGLTHPADKKDATETFKSLKKHGYPIDADEIRAWASRNGWNHRAANALAAVATKYQN
ncbi:hypothetical protein [Burkholderia pseudomallei]|uniref:hypothetical protein n=1 Tax=Burkholderia pseudomallei TaxID=28450 RepID=UPI00050EED61|nr:hypothetical protein [Burkholderia pseudomallei]KGC29858.1 hypothetical protein DO62_811 [Burkholderia pseudomallei]